MFYSLIMKDTNLGPPDFDSPQRYTSGYGKIVKFSVMKIYNYEQGKNVLHPGNSDQNYNIL